MENTAQKEPLKIERKYLIRMLAKNSGELIGQMDYYSFLGSVPSDQMEKYDEHHVILRGYTKEQFTAGIRSR